MARIADLRTGNEVILNGRTLFGRSTACAAVLTSQSASKEHASIDWDGTAWTLRDLGSRNGTRINDAPLADREWRLELGDRIAFGDAAEVWEWRDDSAPAPQAVGADGRRVVGSRTLLVLPDETSPQASIYARFDTWELDTGGQQRLVRDGETIDVDGSKFVLVLPDARPELARTKTLEPRARLASGWASFRVSTSEDHVRLTLGVEDGARELSPRAFDYMLLTLARRRKRDQENGISADEAGWAYADELSTQLATTPERLNVDVHRARQAVSRLGLFDDPDNIVERRPGELRIGTGKLTVERSGARGGDSAPPTPGRGRTRSG